MRVLVVTPPEPIVDLDLAKAHLRVTTDDEDVLIESYVEAAQASVDGPLGWLSRSIAVQTLEARAASFSCFARLPFGPVQSIASVVHIDAEGEEVEVDVALYQLVDGGLGLAASVSWPSVHPSAEAVRVRYVAGYDTPPAAVRQAVLLLIGQWFRNRSAVNVGNIVSSLPNGVESLLAPFRYLGT